MMSRKNAHCLLFSRTLRNISNKKMRLLFSCMSEKDATEKWAVCQNKVRQRMWSWERERVFTTSSKLSPFQRLPKRSGRPRECAGWRESPPLQASLNFQYSIVVRHSERSRKIERAAPRRWALLLLLFGNGPGRQMVLPSPFRVLSHALWPPREHVEWRDGPENKRK